MSAPLPDPNNPQVGDEFTIIMPWRGVIREIKDGIVAIRWSNGYSTLETRDWVASVYMPAIDWQARTEKAEAALRTVHGILFAHTDNEGTADPWWAVVRNAGLGRIAVLEGPYFSRESADRVLNARRHDYGDKAYVYCFSGHRSRQYKELRSVIAAAIQEAK